MQLYVGPQTRLYKQNFVNNLPKYDNNKMNHTHNKTTMNTKLQNSRMQRHTFAMRHRYLFTGTNQHSHLRRSFPGFFWGNKNEE